MHHTLARSLALLACGIAPALAQTIQPPFNGIYGFTDLGTITGVPTPFGGLVFKAGDPTRLLIGGTANGPAGAVYEVQVTRDTTGHLTGFTGTPTLVATAPGIDGGLQYGPGGVLFYTSYPSNQLGQIKPGSTAPDKVTALAGFGINGSVGALSFVPPGYPHAGELKLASYSGQTWHGMTLTPDANGTYDLVAANGPVAVQGGPEGILYVPPGSSLIPNYQYLLLTEYQAGTIAIYQVDVDGNPLLATRLPFMTGLGGAEGATTDPITGDLVFSTFNSGNRVLTVHGFGVCGAFANYGAGIAGSGGAPHMNGAGCAGRGQVASIGVVNGLPQAPGLLAAGFLPQSLPVFNGSLLVQVFSTTFHTLDAAGTFTLPALLPANPAFSGLHVYFQSFYVDPSAAFGIAATDGLHMTVR